ncbi:hypothetical protein ACL03H_23805, partial [Saccharopolyspora sp. MS10]
RDHRLQTVGIPQGGLLYPAPGTSVRGAVAQARNVSPEYAGVDLLMASVRPDERIALWDGGVLEPEAFIESATNRNYGQDVPGVLAVSGGGKLSWLPDLVEGTDFGIITTSAQVFHTPDGRLITGHLQVGADGVQRIQPDREGWTKHDFEGARPSGLADLGQALAEFGHDTGTSSRPEPGRITEALPETAPERGSRRRPAPDPEDVEPPRPSRADEAPGQDRSAPETAPPEQPPMRFDPRLLESGGARSGVSAELRARLDAAPVVQRGRVRELPGGDAVQRSAFEVRRALSEDGVLVSEATIRIRRSGAVSRTAADADWARLVQDVDQRFNRPNLVLPNGDLLRVRVLRAGPDEAHHSVTLAPEGRTDQTRWALGDPDRARAVGSMLGLPVEPDVEGSLMGVPDAEGRADLRARHVEIVGQHIGDAPAHAPGLLEPRLAESQGLVARLRAAADLLRRHLDVDAHRFTDEQLTRFAQVVRAAGATSFTGAPLDALRAAAEQAEQHLQEVRQASV